MDRNGGFRDVDMNQHYTVEMIVARSVDGVEQLMAKSDDTRALLLTQPHRSEDPVHVPQGREDRSSSSEDHEGDRVADGHRVAFLDPNVACCALSVDHPHRVGLQRAAAPDWRTSTSWIAGRRLTGAGRDGAEAPVASKGLKPSSVGCRVGTHDSHQ